MSSQPWLKFYPRDWRGDQALRAVSISARGLWMEMLCIMHEASPYGHLVLGGSVVSSGVLARMSGLGAEECGGLLAELQSAGVFSRTRKGVIYSRRMIKDKTRSEKGRKSIAKRWGEQPENKRQNGRPNSLPDRKPITQKPEAREEGSDTDVSGAGSPPIDPTKALFDLGVALLTKAGKTEREARSMVGKWRKAIGDEKLRPLLMAAFDKSEPLEWIQAAVNRDGEMADEHVGAVLAKFG